MILWNGTPGGLPLKKISYSKIQIIFRYDLICISDKFIWKNIIFAYFRGDCCGERANFVSVYIAKSDQSTQPTDKVQPTINKLYTF